MAFAKQKNRLESLLQTLFILILFLFPFGEILRFQLSSSVAVTANDIGIAGLVLFWYVKKAVRREKNNYTYQMPIYIFVGIAFLSLIINSLHLQLSELFIASLYLGRFILYVELYFLVAGFDKIFKEKISNILVAVGSFVVLGGYIQYFLYPNLRNLYYLGWDEHLYRMFASFLDPNFAGCFFVLFLLFVFRILLKNNESKQRLLYGFLTSLTAGALFLTYSRSAFLMLVVSVLFFLILIKQKNLVIVFLILSFVFLFLSTRLLKSEGTNLLRTTSSLTRITSSQQALTIARDYPLFGIGFNTYGFAQKKYGFLKENAGIVNHAAFGTDNSFLFVLATTGIVGFLSYIFLWFTILKNEYRNSNKILSVVIISSIIGVFVSSSFVNSLFYPFIMEWLWILLGLKENT